VVISLLFEYLAVLIDSITGHAYLCGAINFETKTCIKAKMFPKSGITNWPNIPEIFLQHVCTVLTISTIKL